MAIYLVLKILLTPTAPLQHTAAIFSATHASLSNYCITVTAAVGPMQGTQPDPLSGPHLTVLPKLCKLTSCQQSQGFGNDRDERTVRGTVECQHHLCWH